MPYKERLERPRASLLEFLLLLAAHFEFIGVIVHAARVGIHLLGAPLMEVFQSATEAGEASLLGTVTTKSLANDHKNAGQLTKVELKKEGILAGVGYKRPLFTNKVQRIQDKVPNKFKRKKKNAALRGNKHGVAESRAICLYGMLCAQFSTNHWRAVLLFHFKQIIGSIFRGKKGGI